MRRLVAGVTALLATAVPFATPAFASIDSPSADATVTTQPTVKGQQGVDGDRTADKTVDRVTVTLTPSGGGSPVSLQGCAAASCSGALGTFSATFDLPVNGTYTAVATAEHDSRSPLDPARTKSSAPVTFGVAIPPAPPRRLVAEPNGAARTVSLSWSPNSEADLVGYQLYRGVDGASPEQYGSPLGRSTTSFVDQAGDGGQFTYYVLAIRRGATSTSAVISNPSNTASATIDRVAPPTTVASSDGGSAGATSGGTSGGSTAPAGGSATPGGLRPQTSATPVRITPGAHLDFSGYAPNAVPLNLGPAPAPADPGYKDTLPYQAHTNDAVADGSTGGDEAALPVGSLTTTTSETNRRALLGFLAGAMLLFMLSMHLRWLLRRAAPLAG